MEQRDRTTRSAPPSSVAKRRRIVLATFGSLGDLHPYIALAIELEARGHEAIIATSAKYREKIEALGIGFSAVRPDIPAEPELILPFFDMRRGPERLVRDFMMPVLRDSYEDTLRAAEGADLLVAHPLTFSARLVAEKKKLAWASTALAPTNFFSVYDPPVLAPAQFLARLRFLGPAFYRPLFRIMMSHVRTWSEPWHRLRAELELAPTKDDPMFIESASPSLLLALFSEVIGSPQPDWPKQTVLTGFSFYDRDGGEGLPRELAQFLDDGEPPIVFTLGSSAVMHPGEFYEHSARAAAQLKRRAILLVGRDLDNRPASLPPNVIAAEYAPYSELFPKCCAIVHSGGIGTTAQALRAGIPTIVVPFAFDQPDNADRAKRIGVARVIQRHRYDDARVRRELTRLLDDPSYSAQAFKIGEKVKRENGAARACDALERLIPVE